MFKPGKTGAGKKTIVQSGSYSGDLPKIEQLEEADIAALLPSRPSNSHKGSYGKALLVAGSTAYAGAAILSATAAVRGGAGITRVAVPKELRASMAVIPAAICHPCGTGSEWDTAAAKEAAALFSQADAIAIGPGIGRGNGIAGLMEAAFDTKKPLVLDADALNTMAEHKELQHKLHAGVIVTPHPGEMARLLKKDIEDVTADTIAVAKAAAMNWGCTVLLKGAVSVIAGAEGITVNTTGNAGLAKGGSGDVLTGITLALLAQGLTTYNAARTAAYLLGLSADKALLLLQNRMLAPMDLTQALQSLIQE